LGIEIIVFFLGLLSLSSLNAMLVQKVVARKKGGGKDRRMEREREVGKEGKNTKK
jgi:hypothetical protein